MRRSFWWSYGIACGVGLTLVPPYYGTFDSLGRACVIFTMVIAVLFPVMMVLYLRKQYHHDHAHQLTEFLKGRCLDYWVIEKSRYVRPIMGKALQLRFGLPFREEPFRNGSGWGYLEGLPWCGSYVSNHLSVIGVHELVGLKERLSLVILDTGGGMYKVAQAVYETDQENPVTLLNGALEALEKNWALTHESVGIPRSEGRSA